jgi:tetratricopeptide (TPR) repeat protein
MVGEMERGTRRPQNWIKEIYAAFPEIQNELRSAYTTLLKEDADVADQSEQRADELASIQQLIRAGQYTDAVHAITKALGDAADPLLRLRLLELYTDIVGEAVILPEQHLEASTYEAILDDAEKAELYGDLCRFLERRVHSLARNWRYEEALEILQGRLRVTRPYATLWFQLGRIRWGQDRFADAYASISFALTLGFSRQVGLLTRGQLLADWGRMPEAIADLGMAVETTEDPALAGPSHAAYALSLGITGDQERCISELKAAEEIGGHHNSLTHYFCARLYALAIDDPRRTLDAVSRAVLADTDLRLLNPSQIVSLSVAAELALKRDETLDPEVVELFADIWGHYVGDGGGPSRGLTDERLKVESIVRSQPLWTRIRDRIEDLYEISVGDDINKTALTLYIWNEKFRKKFYVG